MTETIFALASGAPPCGVAIIRVSGPEASVAAKRLCGRTLEPRTVRYCELRDPVSGDLIDHGLCIFFSAPASFTGEDCLELQVHGSRAVVLKLLRTLGALDGCRLAEPGEFIRRAFNNDKLALTDVEGVAELLDARTEAQRRQALFHAGGHLADRVDRWREMLLDARALLEAEIDFADEGEAPSGVIPDVIRTCGLLLDEWRQALVDADRGEQIRSGYRVVITGAPNVGKSSLMNALVRRDVAIVSEYSGTTRDVIEVELDLLGYSIVLCDTAGIRETGDPVEAIGIQKSNEAQRHASLILRLGEATGARPIGVALAGPKEILVASKSDVSGDMPDWADVSVSVKTGSGLDQLIELIAKAADAALGGEPPLIANQRQRGYIEASTRLLSVLVAHEPPPIEILAEDLRLCSDLLSNLIGGLTPDDILGSVFARFCMGK